MVTFRGFRGSPVSKGLLIATSVTSVYYLSSFSKHVKAPALLSLLAFPDPGALLLGSGLLYQSSTTLERQSGSQKHLSFVIVMQGLHAALMTLSRGSAPATTGPLPFIFASLTLYLLDTPSTQHFTLMGMRLTDKVFPVAASLQLLFISPYSALWKALCGVLFGVVYWADCLGIRRHLKAPGFIAGPVGGLVGRVRPADQWRRMVAPAAHPRRGAREPAVRPPALRTGGGVVASREGVERLTAMGFSEGEARSALEQCDNNVQAAASLLL